jgi:hypothetical protein
MNIIGFIIISRADSGFHVKYFGFICPIRCDFMIYDTNLPKI